MMITIDPAHNPRRPKNPRSVGCLCMEIIPGSPPLHSTRGIGLRHPDMRPVWTFVEHERDDLDNGIGL